MDDLRPLPLTQVAPSLPCSSRTTTSVGTSLKLTPLDLPEILTRICQFIPLWSGEGFHREFQPLSLLRCSEVSRAFRQTCLPILWFVYDGFRMRNVPAAILTKYSHLFRIISNTGPFKGPFRCNNLIELSTVYGQEWSRELLVTNPGLKRLVWGGPYHRRIETLEQQQEWELELKALMGLGNLDVLTTSGFSLGEGIFVKVLRNNASKLSNLQLSSAVEGVTSIEGLELPHLTELHIAFGGTESPALVDLVRCCPRLQRLSLTGSRTRSPVATPAPLNVAYIGHHSHNNGTGHMNMNMNSSKEFQIERLSQNIQEFCPELSSIKFTSNHSSGSSTGMSIGGSLQHSHSGVHMNQCFLHDHELAALVNACRHLESFSADMATLNYALAQALKGQQRSLQSLTLSFYPSVSSDPTGSDRVREVHCVRQLKASLRQLKELSLSWNHGLMINTISMEDLVEEILLFLEEPWACSSLETLSINGMIEPVALPSSLPSSPAAAATRTTDFVGRAGAGAGAGYETKTPIECLRQFSRSHSNGSLHNGLNGSAQNGAFFNNSISNADTELVIQSLSLSSLDLSSLTKLRNLNLDHASYERKTMEKQAIATLSSSSS
ncbi:hypothetical protein BX616_000965 [Lobosporangium transversale]|uniref:F-box domain-containing protein n=1 Tax=Lobosporangium transversale TaxID=64571 RepID=A0A1Y2H521_9FUNG|nr:hypothetical protein BCR41DRAFT_344516 [Lobosporangium transversale]KAF9905632.1 hypothetical protein BX616_000965 [Lobosporangium transversale]ORZ29081.1 hypothetical protein BCR41DRAFT_344516 [Lobosporangium transversale]|eukprot:XP_021886754.1 hypothetical protein BCR41DRAFT_344516 [Lobosporangium transversale]